VSPAEVLEAAADLIESRGWCQGRYAAIAVDGGSCGHLHPEATCWCAEGAIGRVAGLTLWALWQLDGRCGALAAMRDYLGRSVVTWNDEKGRTAEEVARELRACAAKLRGGAQ